jgi:hypothetical protein
MKENVLVAPAVPGSVNLFKGTSRFEFLYSERQIPELRVPGYSSAPKLEFLARFWICSFYCY